MNRLILGAVVAASLVLTGLPAHASSPSDVGAPSAITGWPARGPMLGMICPGVSVCYAVGSLPQAYPLPTNPPTSPPGAIIARTEDGGQSWAFHVDRHAVFGSMACPSPTQCYVTAGHPHVRTIDQHHQIVTWTGGVSVTRDGGKTWQEHAVTNAGGTNAVVACPAVTTCVLWGEEGNPAGSRATVYRTTDGGNSWKASQVITHGQGSVARLVCPTIQTCYLYGGMQGTAVSESQDGGRTWRVLPRSDMFALSGVPPRALAHLGGISCPSAHACYTAQGEPRCKCDAWGPYGTIFSTQDGGNHWARLYRAQGGNYPDGAIDCPIITACYAVGSKQRDILADQIILSTKDAGQSWAIHRLPVVGLSCPSADVCYAFAYSGAVYKTTDGGAAWQPLP